MADEVRRELLAMVAPTRAEAGCVAMHVYEAVREPVVFYIHSEWRDEAAFAEHAGFAHTVRFVEAVSGCVTHEVQGVRTREIA